MSYVIEGHRRTGIESFVCLKKGDHRSELQVTTVAPRDEPDTFLRYDKQQITIEILDFLGIHQNSLCDKHHRFQERRRRYLLSQSGEQRKRSLRALDEVLDPTLIEDDSGIYSVLILRLLYMSEQPPEDGDEDGEGEGND